MSLTGTWSFWLGQSWSLAIEEQFYALMPLALWLVSTKRLNSFLLAMIALAPLLRIACYLLLNSPQAGTELAQHPRRHSLVVAYPFCTHSRVHSVIRSSRNP